MLTVKTAHPVALWSRDHTDPGGTMNDDSRNRSFNTVLSRVMPGPRAVMDLGCAGGGLVKDLLDDGHLAVGLEGSDYSLLRRRAQWGVIPGNLFTADITEPFTVEDGGAPVLFDLITAWEVMEHIPEERLPGLCANVLRHLKPGGVFLCSVSTGEAYHHVCVHGRGWWVEALARLGLKENGFAGHFGLGDWVRGPLQNARDSFHLSLGAA